VNVRFSVGSFTAFTVCTNRVDLVEIKDKDQQKGEGRWRRSKNLSAREERGEINRAREMEKAAGHYSTDCTTP